MTTPTKLPPAPPVFPESRIGVERPGGLCMFENEAEYQAWKKEPFWRRFFGFTAFDRRLTGKA